MVKRQAAIDTNLWLIEQLKCDGQCVSVENWKPKLTYDLITAFDVLEHFYTISEEDLSKSNRAESSDKQFDTLNLSSHEKTIIIAALKKFNSNISQSAKALGINRTTLYEKIKRYDL